MISIPLKIQIITNFIDGKSDSTDCFTIEKYNSKVKDSPLAYLHSKECWDGCENSCPELPHQPCPERFTLKNNKNEVHIQISHVLNSGVIDWVKITTLVDGFRPED